MILDSNWLPLTFVSGIFYECQQHFNCRDALRPTVAKDASAIHQHLKLVELMVDLRPDAVFSDQFALEAAGQASQAGSNQAAANLDSCAPVHHYF